MKNLTFTDYMCMVNEEIADEVTKIQSDIAAVDASIQQRTAPLIQRKTQLNKMLAMKMKQQEQQKQQKPPGPPLPPPASTTPGTAQATGTAAPTANSASNTPGASTAF